MTGADLKAACSAAARGYRYWRLCGVGRVMSAFFASASFLAHLRGGGGQP